MALKFKYGEVEVTVRPATVRDELHAGIITAQLTAGTSGEDWGMWQQFGDLCSQTVRAKGLPFDPITLHQAKVEEIRAAYQAFLELDKRVLTLWVKAINEANKPIGELIDVVVDETDPNG